MVSELKRSKEGSRLLSVYANILFKKSADAFYEHCVNVAWRLAEFCDIV